MSVNGAVSSTVTLFWSDSNSSLSGETRLSNMKFSTHLDLELRYSPENVYADRYVTPIIYAIGFPGNVISFIVWIRRRMRHSSGLYLAALALGNLTFLVLHSMLELHNVWGVSTLDSSGLCEAFPVLYIATQFLSPLLVLSFAVERYISICHPLKRKQYCTTRRAKIVISFLVSLSLCMSSIYGYFYYYNPNDSECELRQEVTQGGHLNFFVIWNVCTEVLFFFPVLIGALVLNILVIREMRKNSRVEIQKVQRNHQRTSAMTVMLLVVSFYQIITTLPVTFILILYFVLHARKLTVLESEFSRDVIWTRYQTYLLVKAIIKEMGSTRYAINILIYLIFYKMFRKELKMLVCRTTEHPRILERIKVPESQPMTENRCNVEF